MKDKVGRRQETLRGQPFVAKKVHYELTGEDYERVCDECFYRWNPKSNSTNGDCRFISRGDAFSPKILFCIAPGERLPKQLDGKEVGNYCPYWLEWTAIWSD